MYAHLRFHTFLVVCFPYNSLIIFFFFFCIFLFCWFIRKTSKNTYTFPNYPLRICRIFLSLNLYIIGYLKSYAKKKGQTPTILVRMNVCLIGQDTRISHCRCICMCMCYGLYIYVIILPFFFFTLITSWLRSYFLTSSFTLYYDDRRAYAYVRVYTYICIWSTDPFLPLSLGCRSSRLRGSQSA